MWLGLHDLYYRRNVEEAPKKARSLALTVQEKKEKELYEFGEHVMALYGLNKRLRKLRERLDHNTTENNKRYEKIVNSIRPKK